MWKFKASKYKNAAAKIPKKEEWITDISACNLNSSCGNHIEASAAYMVFNTDLSGGGTLGVLPLSAKGRFGGENLTTIQAHSDFVTDFNFSHFDDYLLATCSQDSTAKIWHLPADGVSGTLCNPACILTHEDKQIENVLWNPSADNVLALSLDVKVKIFDVLKQTSCLELADHGDQVQSLSWNGDGSQVVTSARDKAIRIFDVRAKKMQQSVDGHQSNKDSRVLWLADKDQILSTGFNMTRQREVYLWDTRNFNRPIKSLSFDSSTGILMPFFDSDTAMIFIAGKGDTSIRYLELTDKDPYLVENSVETVEQLKGLTLVPKRALDVMKCEVNRLLVLGQHSIIPVPYIVPRKSYRDFNADLYPDTFSGVPTVTCAQWLNGETKAPTSVSLDPSRKSKLLLRRRFGLELEGEASEQIPSEKKSADEFQSSKVSGSETQTNASTKQSSDVGIKESQKISFDDGSKSFGTMHSSNLPSDAAAVTEKPISNDGDAAKQKPAKILAAIRQSKFRHLHGSPMHKSLNIENVRNLSKSIPGESDYFHANRAFCAVPLGGAGGLIAILSTENRGRLPDTGSPALQNGSSVTDFVFDPFDDHRLVVGCDDAKIRIWNIPKGGLTETTDNASGFLRGHTEKIYFVRFHPHAADVLASGSYDMTVRLWDLQSEQERIKLIGHTDTIFCFSWSQDGKKCATSCKDGQIRIYDPRSSVQPVSTGAGLEGSRGGRLVWTCDDQILIATGFDKSSVREVVAFDPHSLSSPLYKIDLDTSPSILVPYYDADSSTLFLTGRGDSTVKAYEVAQDHPHLFSLSDFKADSLHQALSFLPKTEIDVRKVEFARALRLTANSIEPVSFKVPRTKMEFFQDDLFPDTRVTWKSTLSSAQWFQGENRTQTKISLKPDDMKSLSEAPAEMPKQQKYQSFEVYKATYKTDEQKKEELLSAMNTKLCLNDGPLPQDLTEGVDPDEWDD